MGCRTSLRESLCRMTLLIGIQAVALLWLYTQSLAGVEHATPPEKIEYKYYLVEGESAVDLRNWMNAHGPADLDGIRRDALTEWYLTWQWNTGADGKPDFLSTRSTLKIVVSMPRWKGLEKAPSSLAKQWTTFLAAMEKHEREHVRMVLEYEDQVVKRIKDAARADSNLTIERANAIGREVSEEMRERDREYDQRTRSGYLEGVRFP